MILLVWINLQIDVDEFLVYCLLAEKNLLFRQKYKCIIIIRNNV